ncbi:hypothetical protein SAMD00079811_78790 (plasmid) [Scytonema sp. HK-05]|uniref:hypothetical protein n=1 Tax=Scytonema sp. HK-05 TaxID=1137095 RepID=UPI000935D42A|nr:hypothetical protein [Scytonema sp. HK-05]OKH57065.1 hypothetical protein NIES2130_21740 [Scytonema sp. HK-05]BAY50250.1 hypothetical protein SAMD00079811_78790 [Scytonema sp. HK-05]
MGNVREPIAIQQELQRISDRLRKIFGQTHPQFDSVFEDVSAVGYYYIPEAGYRLESAIKTVERASPSIASN